MALPVSQRAVKHVMHLSAFVPAAVCLSGRGGARLGPIVWSCCGTHRVPLSPAPRLVTLPLFSGCGG